MSNQIQFQSFDFQSSAVRIITDPNQEFWFCANDVCAILDYANPRQAVQKNCKPKGVSIRDTLTSGGNQEMIYINEPNLYRLIIKSRKPEAEPFEAWVFEEVLPQIRKTGKYSVQQQLALPEPEPKYPFELTEYEIQLLLWLWFSNYNTHELLDMLIEPLEYIGSRYAPTIRSHKAEYARFIDESVEIIYRLTKDFHKSRDENWVNPLFGVRSVIFHQKEMRKKHEAKMKKAEEKRFPHTNF